MVARLVITHNAVADVANEEVLTMYHLDGAQFFSHNEQRDKQVLVCPFTPCCAISVRAVLLNKSLYSLKQSGRKRQGNFASILVGHRFERSS